jgi:hypothetical protein
VGKLRSEILNVDLARQKHKTGKTKDLGGLTVAAKIGQIKLLPHLR